MSSCHPECNNIAGCIRTCYECGDVNCPRSLNSNNICKFTEINNLSCPDCGVKDCGGAPRFKDTTLEERLKIRELENKEIEHLSKINKLLDVNEEIDLAYEKDLDIAIKKIKILEDTNYALVKEIGILDDKIWELHNVLDLKITGTECKSCRFHYIVPIGDDCPYCLIRNQFNLIEDLKLNKRKMASQIKDLENNNKSWVKRLFGMK